MSKYTAGPWLMQHEFDDEPTYIVGPGGEDIATIPPGGLAIARLIAAAPEMYEALKQTVVICELMMNGGQKRDICWKTGLRPMLAAALAKAGG